MTESSFAAWARESGAVMRLRDTVAYFRAHLRLLAILSVGGAGLGVVVSLIQPNTYSAEASFYPESRSATPDLTSALGGLGSIVGALGFTPQTSTFFVDLLKSRTFYDSLAATQVAFDSTGATRRVADILVPRAKSEALRRWAARTRVRSMMHVTVLPSGVVEVRFEARSPQVASSMADAAIAILDRINVAYRRRQAAGRREFTQQFLENVAARLDSAENRLEQFSLANRMIAGSPALTLRYQGLNSEVERLRALKQQLETTIENARLTEFNDAPVVVEVDRAIVPETKSGPNRKLTVVGFVFLTLAASFWLAYFRAPRAEGR